MAAPSAGLRAPWCSVEDAKVGACAAGLTDEQLQPWLLAASEVAWGLSGWRWSGAYEAVVRPGANWPDLATERPHSAAPGGYGWGWGCPCLAQRVYLQPGPVVEVTEVLLDGAVLPPEQYRVDDYTWLVRLADPDGRYRWWPCSQRRDLPTTEAGTWQVTYQAGATPPELAKRAAAALACQLARAAKGDKCDLDPQVVSKTRQGVNIVLQDPGGLFDPKRSTGVPLLDYLVRTYNPARITAPAAIASPDVPMAPTWADTGAVPPP